MARLLMFASIREAAGVRATEVDAATVGEVLKIAAERYGAEFERILSICSVLVREETVAADRVWDVAVGAEDEIALLPPVSGGSKMVDVGDKGETTREATAVCRVTGHAAVIAGLLKGELRKGDAVGAAKVAGVMAAKRTPELIPLCHPVRTTFAGVEIAPDAGGIEVRATVRGVDRTGFEMEALTACAVAALTLYDMAKGDDPRMRIEGLRIVAKSGGKSGSVSYE